MEGTVYQCSVIYNKRGQKEIIKAIYNGEDDGRVYLITFDEDKGTFVKLGIIKTDIIHLEHHEIQEIIV